MSFSGERRVCDGCAERRGRWRGEAVGWLYLILPHGHTHMQDEHVRHYCVRCLRKAPKCRVVAYVLDYNAGRLR